MIIDVTGTELIPGFCGNDCPGRIVCCDECEFLRCCIEGFDMNECEKCNKTECPHCKADI